MDGYGADLLRCAGVWMLLVRCDFWDALWFLLVYDGLYLCLLVEATSVVHSMKGGTKVAYL